MNLRFAQPHVPIDLVKDRIRLARMYVDLTRALHEIAFPKKARGFGADLETLMVLLCVFIGDAEGRPTTVSKLASHAGLPRTTVYRRLEQLIKIKKVTRVVQNYYIAPGATSPDDHGRLAKLVSDYLRV